MKLRSLLLFPLLLLLLAFQCNGRTVSRCELRDKLREKITLSERTQNLTDIALTLIVCQLEKISQLKTSTVNILGQRDTTTTPPTTTTTTTTIPTTNTTSTAPTNQTNLSNQTLNSDPTVPPALTNTTTTNTTTPSTTPANQTNVSNQTLNSDPALPPGLTNATSDLNQTLSGVNNTSSDGGQDQDQEEEPLGEDDEEEEEPLAEDEEPFSEVIGDTYDEEGEYLYVDQESTVDFHMEDWRRLMELLNEEENEFDEEQLMIADDKLSGDNDGFGSGSEMFQMNWSLGYHGIFQLTDSYFCQSSARWSQNVCNSTCGAFSDDDITDDLDCFVDSLYWLYVLRTVGYQCYETTDFFGQCN
ncbi:uncharacterized protein LOC133403703 [Phycodurus eques]|uniref:uncharacterized protein LOC133403703 n=1 Tax=Phycodurus eques TaxID=693459 RepID=UPI002ACDF6EA|nr:uncharacterized protein LOC133403703 [Phycodurus eques]